MQYFGKGWETLLTVLDNRECAQEHLALQVHTQSEELVNIWMKAKVDGKQMSGLYTKFCTEAKKM